MIKIYINLKKKKNDKDDTGFYVNVSTVYHFVAYKDLFLPTLY